LIAAALLTACGGSGQSGDSFVFLSVDGFSLSSSGEPVTSSVNSALAAGTTTTACVTLRNNLKNPTITVPTGLDNVIIQSYTVTLQGVAGPFTFGASVLVPAGRANEDDNNIDGNTATFSVILVPAAAKAGVAMGTAAVAQITFRGRDGRGNSVSTEGGVTVLFVGAGATDSSCAAAAA
jgi:hypothetical protein